MRPPSDSRPTRPPRVIKRYANRKLYDTEESTYVTLEEIADAIREGEEVRIIDSKTQEDLTSVTLTQIIFEQEKKRSQMPIGLLLGLIRSGGAQISGYLRGRRITREQPIARAVTSQPSTATARVEGRGQAEGDSTQQQDKVGQTKELISQVQRSLDDWNQKFSALPTLANEMSALEKRIRELEARLEELDFD